METVVNLVTSHGSVTLLDQQRSLVKCTTVITVPHDDYASSDSDSVGMINTVDPSKEYNAKLLVQGNPVTFLLDTGASASLLPKKYVDTSKLNLEPTKTL